MSSRTILLKLFVRINFNNCVDAQQDEGKQMSAASIPDFHEPVRINPLNDLSSGQVILHPYQDEGNHVLLPQTLELDQRTLGADGTGCDFELQLVRGPNPFLPPQPYGMLSFKLRPIHALDSVLPMLRSRYPRASLEGARFSSGVLWIQVIAPTPSSGPNEGKALADDVIQPIALAWNGLDTMRYTVRLSQASVIFLKRALQEEVVTFRAVAHMVLQGIAPRLPVTVQFDPATLVAALHPLDKENEARRVADADVQAFFRRSVAMPNPALHITGEITDLDVFAEAMTDRVRTAFGESGPSKTAPTSSGFTLPKIEAVGTGRFEWDLARPQPVWRIHALEFDPLRAAQTLVKTHGLARIYREVIVPPFATGMVPIAAEANLPENCANIIQLGATLHAPSNPPARPHAIFETLLFDAQGRCAPVALRFSPKEAPQFFCTSFALVAAPDGLRKLEGQPIKCEGTRVLLGATDFPLTFIPIQATPALLELGTVRGRCQWTQAGQPREQLFELTLKQPVVTLCLEKSISDAQLTLTAHALANDCVIAMQPIPARAIDLDLHSFREYGPHTIQIECAFEEGASRLVAIDLLPEGKAESVQAITTLTFTPTQPKRTWSWMAQSPFQAGYRYRRRASVSQPAAAWSLVQWPFETLRLRAQPDEQAPGGDDAMKQDVTEVQDVRCLQDPRNPERFFYLPAAPTSELAPNGSSTLLLFVSDKSGILQLGAQWHVSESIFAALRTAIIAKHTWLEAEFIQFAPVPITLHEAVVLLGDGSAGDSVPLASTASSGYPPYIAVFSIALNADQVARARAALSGRGHFLQVAYRGSMPRDFAAALLPNGATTFEARTDVATWFAGQDGLDHIQVLPGK